MRKRLKTKPKKVCAYMSSHELFWCERACMLSYFSHVQLSATLRTVLPGSSVDGILQARVPEWVVMPSFRGSS